MPSLMHPSLPLKHPLPNQPSKPPPLQSKPNPKHRRPQPKTCDRLYIFTARIFTIKSSPFINLLQIATSVFLKGQKYPKYTSKEDFFRWANHINQNQIQILLIMLKIFSKQAFRSLYASSLNNKLHFNFANAVKVLRESDELSLSDIDSILGNEPSELQVNKNQGQQIQKRELFYNLVPTKNEHFPPCIDPDFVELLETPNQNIMHALNINVESSFKDYCTAMSNFWRQDELYGSISPQTKIQPQSIEFLPVLTVDSKYLERVRNQFVVNLSMPGSIEAQDPRNFMELRPVQEFRNTPIIPISESAMKKHKEKLEEYHRRQMVLQISKESILNFFLFVTAVGVCGYMIYMLLQKQEERTVAYTRLKYNRRMGIQEAPTFRI